MPISVRIDPPLDFVAVLCGPNLQNEVIDHFPLAFYVQFIPMRHIVIFCKVRVCFQMCPHICASESRELVCTAEHSAQSPILRLSDDPDVNNVIRFLREREIVHFQRFGIDKLVAKVSDANDILMEYINKRIKELDAQASVYRQQLSELSPLENSEKPDVEQLKDCRRPESPPHIR